jgi:hypothetical protein
LGLILALTLIACAAKQKNILETSESQVKLRSMQSRVYDTADRDRLLRTIIATLQDLGFVIDDADKDLGTVSGTKRSGYSLRMTVSIRPRGAQQTIVRSNAQYNLITVEDPEPYQQFFSSLSKALFIEAHLVGSKSAAGGGGTKVKPVPKKTPKSGAAPATAPTAKTTNPPQETPKLASAPKEAPVVRVGLRRQPMEISNQTQITDMLTEYDFFDRTRNPRGAFKNVLIENKDGTITDQATGLMWQKGGSSKSLDNRSAKKYVQKLNKQGFAGYSDWRMPTVEELASLLARRRKDGVHLAPVFDNNRSTGWSADKSRLQSNYYFGYWIVNFKQGQILEASFPKPSLTSRFPNYGKNEKNYVKAVRSVR